MCRQCTACHCSGTEISEVSNPQTLPPASFRNRSLGGQFVLLDSTPNQGCRGSCRGPGSSCPSVPFPVPVPGSIFTTVLAVACLISLGDGNATGACPTDTPCWKFPILL